ncbi:hypothetical protein DTO166G4_4128 [Paecilomyces variotii]|nr:hypothetical protein DTO166G4_4128 [Paecilomyces variotii]KAJ9231146.1 hypothetical protein DTO166G5_6918 [Paecilomyces variotii]KAJ9243987.1 hypothetical protein DTO169E5_2329 [Paecilomyces variotii]KAJ9263289.1 hypothetical protein DTO195F2_2945 [Paecilomyces variotii]KAJ9307633.1 hypothetical protein DTO217A2_2867 [Paecilomyces variotii]
MYRRPDNTLTVTLTPSSLQKQRKLVAFITYSREFDPRRDHDLLFLFLHIPSSLYLDTSMQTNHQTLEPSYSYPDYIYPFN